MVSGTKECSGFRFSLAAFWGAILAIQVALALHFWLKDLITPKSDWILPLLLVNLVAGGILFAVNYWNRQISYNRPSFGRRLLLLEWGVLVLTAVSVSANCANRFGNAAFYVFNMLGAAAPLFTFWIFDANVQTYHALFPKVFFGQLVLIFLVSERFGRASYDSDASWMTSVGLWLFFFITLAGNILMIELFFPGNYVPDAIRVY